MSTFMSLERAKEVASIPETLAAEIGIPHEEWARRCHEISIALLRTGRFGPGRIARGWASGVPGQHSWIVLGRDVYDPQAVIVDPTLVFYLFPKDLMEAGGSKAPRGITVARAADLTSIPHGKGSIWAHGRPDFPSGPVIGLTPSFELSEAAKLFLSGDVLGSLDRKGWQQLAGGAMEMWPSGEIIAAMDDTPELKALVPVDILGMLTDRNPLGVYLATEGAGVLP